MPEVKRRHHINPVFVLRNFTQVVKKKPHVWVFDRARQQVRHAAPKEVGYRRDYFTILSEGTAPDAIEDIYGRTERIASRTYQKVVDTQVLPERNTEAFGDLMYLVAMLHARAPYLRTTVQEHQQEVIRMQLHMLIRDQASWDQFLDTELGATSPWRTREEVVEFLESGAPVLDQSRLNHDHTITTAKVFHELVPLLVKRQWSLALAPDNGPYFITSECPTALVWNEPFGETIWKFGPPGLEHSGTQLLFPMSNATILIGSDSNDAEGLRARQLEHKDVAAMNSRILLYVSDAVFGARSQFAWFDHRTQSIGDHWQWINVQRPT